MTDEMKHYLDEILRVSKSIGYIGPWYRARLLAALDGIREELDKLEDDAPANKLPSVAGRCIL